MKKIMSICIILSTLIVLTGCTKNNSDLEYSTENINYVEKQEHISSVNNNENDDLNDSSEEFLSTFSTTIHDKASGRMTNLQLASSKLTGVIVKSGQNFSFNNLIGPYNEERGFEKAKIFSSTGEVLEEYGGGICQISTTLYNALLPLNVEILERHTHSKKVQYIEEGKDATLSYGYLDFKFKNTLPYDIEFICQTTDNEVIVKIKKRA